MKAEIKAITHFGSYSCTCQNTQHITWHVTSWNRSFGGHSMLCVRYKVQRFIAMKVSFCTVVFIIGSLHIRSTEHV